MGKRILVVEDDPRYIDLIRIRLEKQGYEVVLAFDGEVGLARAHEEPRPHLILTDILLPKIDGFELCHRLKSDPETEKIPVVMMSAIYLASEDRDRGLQSGAHRYLIKPDAILDKPLRFDELLAQVRYLVGDTQSIPSNWNEDSILLVDDDARNLRLLKLTLKAENYRVHEAGNALDALRILEQEPIDLVLTDIQMPGMSGLELLAEIRATQPRVTIVMMTAYGSEGIAVEAMKSGANDYFTKPINTRELGLRLRENMEKHRLKIDRDRLLQKLKETSQDLMTRVDALEQQNRLLEETGRKIQRASRAQAEFISTISHELRTPMTVIKGALVMATDGADRIDASKRDDLLVRARDQADRVINLTNKLLDHQRITTGAAPHQAAVHDLVHLVRRACASLDLTVEEAGDETSGETSEGTQVRVVDSVDEAPCSVDAEAIERTVINLVANAVKYSPEEAPIEVSVRDAANVWRVEVADRGPGVPDNLKERIFEPFVRQETLKPNVPSTGLGLAIVSSLVNQHDGRVGVDDRPGGGSVFYFEIPKLFDEPARAVSTVVEGIGLADDLADELRVLLERQALTLRLHTDPHVFLADSDHDLESRDLGQVVIDLASPAAAEHLYSLLKELEHHGLQRTCVVPPPESSGQQVTPEASRLFSFVEVLSRRPTASELVRTLTR